MKLRTSELVGLPLHHIGLLFSICRRYRPDISHQRSYPTQVDASSKIASQLGFKFKPSKCGHMQGGQPRSSEPVLMYNTVVPALDINESYRYLGVNFSNKMQQDPSQVFHDMRELMVKTQKSILLPWQKLHAYLVFIHSKSTFFLKNYFISIKTMDRLDVDIRRELKLILGVPKNCSNNNLYAPRRKGGCALKSIVIFKMLAKVILK